MTFRIRTICKPLLVSAVVLTLALGCSSGASEEAKPSKQALTDHFVELAQKEGGLSGLVPEKTLQKVYGCLFDEAYDELSPETLNGMLKVEKFDQEAQYPFDLKNDEKKIFDKASSICEEKFKDDPDLNISPETQNNG